MSENNEVSAGVVLLSISYRRCCTAPASLCSTPRRAALKCAPLLLISQMTP